MADLFSTHSEGLSSPPANLADITPDDAEDLPFVTRAINVAVSGTVQVTMKNGQTSEIFVSAGIPFPLRASRIWATGTTAVNIVALW